MSNQQQLKNAIKESLNKSNLINTSKPSPTQKKIKEISPQQSEIDSEYENNPYSLQKPYLYNFPKPSPNQTFKELLPIYDSYYDNAPTTGRRNTTGNTLTQEYKRTFTRKLLGEIRGKRPKDISYHIQQAAEKIHVYANEISCWLAIYKIVFKIQDELTQNTHSTQDVMRRVEEQLVVYLNHNVHIRQYKVLKIASGITKSLRIKKCTGLFWLEQFVGKYQDQLDSRLNILTKGPRFSKMRTDDSFFASTIEPQARRRRKADIIGQFYLPENEKEQETFLNGYSDNFKANTIKQMDKRIQGAIMNVFKQIQISSNLRSQDLKDWYRRFGKHNVLSMEDRKVTKYQNQKLQQQLLSKIKEQNLQSKSEILEELQEIVKDMHIQEMNGRVLTSWLQDFYEKNCIIYWNDRVMLKGNSTSTLKKIVPNPFQKTERESEDEELMSSSR